MERVSLTDDGTSGDEVVRQSLTGPLETTDLAINRYRVPPGEGLPAGLHAHRDQEEVFVVREGTARFETLREADGTWTAETVSVAAGEAIRFAPGEFQSGHNRGDEDLAVLALGAPRDSDDVRLPVACRDCGRGDLRLATGGDAPTFRCPDCGAAHVPAPCPDCGGDDLRVALGDEASTGAAVASTVDVAPPASETVVVCDDCAATFPAPPLSE